MKKVLFIFLFVFLSIDSFSQGAVTITPGGRIQYEPNLSNRKFVLWSARNNDHQFFGFGINGAVLRYQTDTTWSDHVFFTGINATSSRELFRIKGNGYVGIGTSSPNAPLQFPSDILNRKIVLYEGSNNDHQFYGFGVNPGALRYQTDSPFGDHVFYSAINATSSKELLRIKANGNVGIGSNAPSTKLEVDGFTKLGSDAPAIKHKLLTGTTGAAQGDLISLTHGLTDSKILSINVLVVFNSALQTHVPPSYPVAGYQYTFFSESGRIYIKNVDANSSLILSKPFKVFITYQE
ncbi:MAG TPA: hypothetical protein VK175_12000 [Leadbetterella sp.]|nr:hypothetical protein [Leadbetterella sp.]